MAIVGEIKGVDDVFLEESLELKREYVMGKGADILVMGDDWKGKFDELSDVCEVIYLERTPELSTTEMLFLIFMRNPYQVHLITEATSLGLITQILI